MARTNEEFWALCELLRRLTSTDEHVAVCKHRARLAWVGDRVKNPQVSSYHGVLRHILAFDKQYERTPDMAGLTSYVQMLSQNDLVSGNLPDAEVVRNQLEFLSDVKEDEEVPYADVKDTDVLIDKVVEETRVWFHEKGINTFNMILHGGVEIKKITWSGPSDAQMWLRQWWTKDLVSDTAVAAGLLHEHTVEIQASLEDKLKPTDDNGRLLTGFTNLDEAIVLSPSYIRFVGILGMSGQGKSTFLHTLVYNFARQGKNVLYVSLEHDPAELWEIMAFLHTSTLDRKGLPPRYCWDLGDKAPEGQRPTQAHVDMFAQVLEDIQHRRGLPGMIDAQQINTWDGIVDYLENNHAKNHYDAVVIDYLARLQMEGDSRWAGKMIGETIHKAQRLTRSFDDGRGIVLITPIQTTKEAWSKASEKDQSPHYDINAIRENSEFVHDCDYICSVFATEDDKFMNQSWLETVKPPRRGVVPRTTLLGLDKNSGMMREKGWMANQLAPKDANKGWKMDEPDVEMADTKDIFKHQTEEEFKNGWKPGKSGKKDSLVNRWGNTDIRVAWEAGTGWVAVGIPILIPVITNGKPGMLEMKKQVEDHLFPPASLTEIEIPEDALGADQFEALMNKSGEVL